MILFAKYNSVIGWVLEKLGLLDFDTITEMDDANDYVIVIDTSADKLCKITKNNFAKRYITLFLNHDDFTSGLNSNDPANPMSDFIEYGTSPYMAIISRYIYQNLPTGSEHLSVNFKTPDEYSGGAFKMKIWFMTNSTAPLPGTYDMVKFNVNGRAYQSGQILNQALNDVVGTTKEVNLSNALFITDEITFTPNNIAAGSNLIHMQIHRECGISRGYNDSVFLCFVSIEIPVNKWSS